MSREAGCHHQCNRRHWSPFGFLWKQTSLRTLSTCQCLLRPPTCTLSLPSYFPRLSPSNPVELCPGLAVGAVCCTHLTVRPGSLGPPFHFVSESPKSIASKKAVRRIHWTGRNEGHWGDNQIQEEHLLKSGSQLMKLN